MLNFPDSTELSDKAKEVARCLGSDWQTIAKAVELCVECNVPIALQSTPGVLLTRDNFEGNDLEKRLAVMDAMMRPGVSQRREL